MLVNCAPTTLSEFSRPWYLSCLKTSLPVVHNIKACYYSLSQLSIQHVVYITVVNVLVNVTGPGVVINKGWQLNTSPEGPVGVVTGSKDWSVAYGWLPA